MKEIYNLQKCTASNGRFGAMAAVARRQFCVKLNVIIPHKVQWKPPLRQAAWTLEAIARHSAVQTLRERKKYDNELNRERKYRRRICK